MLTKPCTCCGEEKPLSEYSPHPTGKFKKQPECKKCKRLKQRKYNAKRTKEEQRATNIKHKYGISLEEYESMYAAQSGKCAICDKHLDKLYIDHEHTTGKIRALLCSHCNLGLGHFKDDEEYLIRAIVYLRTHRLD